MHFTYSFIYHIIYILVLYPLCTCLQVPLSPLSIPNTHSTNLRNLNSTSFYPTDYTYNIPTINMCFGLNGTHCFNLIYDTGMMYIIIGDNSTKSSFSKSYIVTESSTARVYGDIHSFAYRTGVIDGVESSEYCSFANGGGRSLYTFNFLIAFKRSEHFNIEGILGLGHGYIKTGSEKDPTTEEIEDKFSYVEYLKTYNLIKNKVFGHEYKNGTHGTFYIGEVPPSFKSKNKYHKCNALNTVKGLYKWYCNLKEIQLLTDETQTLLELTNGHVAFDTGYTDIRGPLEEGLKLYELFINISNHQCHILNKTTDGGSTYKKLMCDYNINIQTFPDIHFTLNDDAELVLKKEDMFRLIKTDKGYKYLCKIIIDIRYVYWNLGEPVLKNYDMMFSYDDDSISFVENLNLKGADYSEIIELNIVVIVLLVISIFVCMKRKHLFSNNKSIFSKKKNASGNKDENKEGFVSAQLSEIKGS